MLQARENNYLEFVNKHPEMKDPSFKKDVAGLVRSRAEDGIPLSHQDAYQIVKARRVMAQQQARAAQEQRARQQSARRIGRAVHRVGTPLMERFHLKSKRRAPMPFHNGWQLIPKQPENINNHSDNLSLFGALENNGNYDSYHW